MRRIFLFSPISNLTLWADQAPQQIQPLTQGLLAWLIGFLLIIGLLFWSFYKMMKTKNPKYGYVVLVGVLLMVGIFFV